MVSHCSPFPKVSGEGAGNRLNMQDTGPPAPWLRTPFVTVPVDGIDIGQVQERVHSGLLITLATQEMGGRLG
jgi:hypothetical protein